MFVLLWYGGNSSLLSHESLSIGNSSTEIRLPIPFTYCHCPSIAIECLEFAIECPRVAIDCLKFAIECPRVAIECLKFAIECPRNCDDNRIVIFNYLHLQLIRNTEEVWI